MTFPYWTTGLCVTLLPNKSPDWVEDILRTFLGAVPALDTTQPYIAHIHAAGSGSIMFENGGFGGMMLEVIRRLSQGTKAVVVLRDFLGNAAFAYAMDGEIITAFDIYFPGDRRGRSPDALDDQLSAVGLLPAYEYVFDEDVEEEDEPERVTGRAAWILRVTMSGGPGVPFGADHDHPRRPRQDLSRPQSPDQVRLLMPVAGRCPALEVTTRAGRGHDLSPCDGGAVRTGHVPRQTVSAAVRSPRAWWASPRPTSVSAAAAARAVFGIGAAFPLLMGHVTAPSYRVAGIVWRRWGGSHRRRRH
ncbi:DUF6461 domain-containing protein [Nonomuraea jabiensis]|uniref:Uncharacterized protein n=1 Tax=Nonomuraea jabiensis TaxID=882448 RepID=A0A7W9G0M6_9ACTN|nr:DUF6461 domain-containing protein [Nonomuraea jabiensis]MBB5775013.1 hypothetical protein [Nonomuraea jabiensis]